MLETRLARHSEGGFSLVELMIVVAIIGILASVAVPLFGRYQLRSKSTEAKTNLSAIRVVEEAYFSESGSYFPADAEPPVIPGSTPSIFDAVTTDYAELGWKPEGDVFFSYAIAISADLNGYTADAAADIDEDGIVQIWGYAKPDRTDTLVPGAIGCDVTLLSPEVMGSCVASNSVF